MSRSHVVDSQLLQGNWSTPEVLEIFSDESRLQFWLDIEAALARVQGRLGVIPSDAAEEISSHCRLECLDMGLFRETLAQTGHMIVRFPNRGPGRENLCAGSNGRPTGGRLVNQFLEGENPFAAA